MDDAKRKRKRERERNIGKEDVGKEREREREREIILSFLLTILINKNIAQGSVETPTEYTRLCASLRLYGRLAAQYEQHA